MHVGVFDAQPTASERQRENLSSRLRREFGLALPDDEDARDARAGAGTHALHYSLLLYFTNATVYTHRFYYFSEMGVKRCDR